MFSRKASLLHLLMSTVNYLASLTDHSEILISVECATDINSDSVQYVLKQFDFHKTVPINDAGRSINVKFSLDASLESNKWGYFQAHRQVYGLIYLAEATNAMESALTLDKFTRLKEQYEPSLYESRCIIFGIDTAIRPSHSNIFQFSSHEAWKSIDYDIKQLIVAIYYKMETKRQMLLQDRHASKVTLLSAPFETPERIISETDGKLYRRMCTGRHHKHLGDIHLLLGLIPDSFQSYNTALDMLISAGDFVWVGCAMEGLCVVSAMILLNDHTAEKDTSSPNVLQSTYTLNPKNLITKQSSGLNLADVKKYCIPTFTALVDKYREAIINYSKDKSVAVVELEACIKATKIFSRAKRYLDASEFIQNAVYINLNIPNPERLKRYDIMGELYKDINFKRKSFFYKRVAAMQCVSQQLKNRDWQQCKNLLVEAISNLSLNTKNFPNGNGWPSVIQRVWRELVFALDKEGNRPLANRHLLHVFLTMFPYMSESDEKDIYASLEAYAKTGLEIPSQLEGFEFELNFYKCPVIKAVLPQIDVDGIRPKKSETKSDSKSVFIYTPSSFNMKEQNDQVINFDWCVNTPCRMDVEVFNPLSHCPILISEFAFIISSNDEDSLESVLFSFSVPPQVTSKVTVSITPLKPGMLKIVGYKYTIFGVQARCFFAENKDIQTSEIAVNVISALPLLRSDFTGARVDYHENDIPEIVAYVGETLQLPFKLTNTGSSHVSSWDVTCKTKIQDGEASLEYDRNFNRIELLSGMSITIPVKVRPKTTSKDLKSPSSCLFVIKYAAKLGEDEWWRSLEVDINFVFRQSIEVTSMTILSSFVNPTCNVKVEVTSHLDDTVELTWNKSQSETAKDSVTVPANCIYSFDCPLLKMTLPENIDDVSDLRDAIVQHVKNVLSISWKMKSARHRHHHGDAGYNFTIQKHDFSKFVNVPIACSVSSNEIDINGNVESALPLAEVTHFSFAFHNASVSKQTFKVAIEIYQDQLNGFIENNLDDCVICLGCTTTSMELSPGDREDFPCDILVLKEGTYWIRAVYTISLLDKSSDVANTIQCYSRPLKIISES